MTSPFRLSDPVQLIALGFGAGLARRMPGTAGTAAAMPLAWWFTTWSLPVQLLVVSVGFLFGCWVCDRAARAVGVHDHPAIVWDEVIGLLVTCLAAPGDPGTLLLAFVLFRVFDIAKPWPIGWLDRRLAGGFGIMLDDVLAGGLAWLVLWLII